MDAFKLRDRVELLEPVRTSDGYGSVATSWSSHGIIHAQVQWKSGKESVSAAEVFSDERIDVILWNKTSIRTDWRVQIPEGNLYQVVAIEPTPSKNMKRVICGRVNE